MDPGYNAAKPNPSCYTEVSELQSKHGLSKLKAQKNT